MPFEEDLSIFVEDFGIEVTFSRSSTEIATAMLIFNAPPNETPVYDRSFYDEKFYAAKVHNSDVELLGVHADIANVAINDTCTINATVWYVIANVPDGTGMASIVLSQNQV